MGKITFFAGVGVGYVLGAAAGRQRFEQIKSAATKTWNNPNVQKGVDAAQDQATKGAKSATGSLKDAVAGSPTATKLVDAVADKVEEKTGTGVSSGTSASPGAASGGSKDSGSKDSGAKDSGSKDSGAPAHPGAPTTGSKAKGPITARSENTDHEASGSGTASADSGFDASPATPEVAPLPKGTPKR